MQKLHFKDQNNDGNPDDPGSPSKSPSKEKHEKSLYLLRLEKAVDNIKFFQEMFNGRAKTLGEQFHDAAMTA